MLSNSSICNTSLLANDFFFAESKLMTLITHNRVFVFDFQSRGCFRRWWLDKLNFLKVLACWIETIGVTITVFIFSTTVFTLSCLSVNCYNSDRSSNNLNRLQYLNLRVNISFPKREQSDYFLKLNCLTERLTGLLSHFSSLNRFYNTVLKLNLKSFLPKFPNAVDRDRVCLPIDLSWITCNPLMMKSETQTYRL